MLYTFDHHLTTDQKLALLDEWLDGASTTLAALASAGNANQHTEQERHIEMLRLWRRLVEVEEELAISRTDLDDPDPLGDEMQEAWCRMTRLQLRLEGVQVRLRAEQAKPQPSAARIERLRVRREGLAEKLRAARAETESAALQSIVEDFAEFECEGGDACTAANPCASCACRQALATVEQ